MNMNKFIRVLIICINVACMLMLVSCQEAKEPGTSTQAEETMPSENESTETVDSDTETDPTTQPDTDTDTDTLDPEETTSQEPETVEEKELLLDPGYTPSISILEFGYDSSLSGNIGANHVNEIELEYFREEADTSTPPTNTNPTVQISMNGEDLEATYVCITSTPYYGDQYYRYMGTDQSGVQALVRFHVASGRLALFNNYPVKVVQEEEALPPLTEKECEEIARNLVFDVARLPGEYEMEVKYESYSSSKTAWYTFMFTRMVDGMETEEYARVFMTDRGRILVYRAERVGNMDGVSLPSDYDEAEINKAVEQKLAAIYAPVLETTPCSYSVYDVRLLRLEDGKLYLKYTMDVRIHFKSHEDVGGLLDRTYLLVALN